MRLAVPPHHGHGAAYGRYPQKEGADGRRFLSAPLHDEEIVLQLFYSNTLYSRTGQGKAGFTSWQKRGL